MAEQGGYRFDDLDPFAARRAKLDILHQLGIDPYPARVPESESIAAVREQGNHLLSLAKPEEAPSVPGAKISGRIMALRTQGALTFLDLRDATGKIQVLCKKDSLGDERYEQLQLLDLGDFLWVAGSLFVTRRGELTVDASEWTILSKALRPLPDLWKGLQDVEQRQRQRYAELIVNDIVRERFQKRSVFTQAMRQFLLNERFLEVETPILEHIPGGADAEPFSTHHNTLDVDFYLRISLELHLKRLIVGGYDRVFEFGRVFRNEGMSTQHLQEFTMLELYYSYISYKELMDFVERMYIYAIQETFGTLDIQSGDDVLHFQGPWPRVTYRELIQQYAGIDILDITDEQLVEKIKEFRVDSDLSLGRGRLLDQLYKKMVRPHLIQPQFLIDHPVEISPLAKRQKDNPRLVERFQVLARGAELGNAFSELNDPLDQRSRFEEQEKLRLQGDTEAQRLDEDFIRAMEYGMPPMAGFGVGIDRLFTVLADLDSIRESVFFPTMRPE